MRNFAGEQQVRTTPRFTRKYLWGILGLSLFFIFWIWSRWNVFFNQNFEYVPDEGGVYTHAMVGSLNNLSPLAKNPSPVDQVVHRLIYRGLLSYNPQNGQFDDALGDLRVNEDQTEYVVNIKSTAKFSNGDAVTAADVLFTYQQTILDPNFDNDDLRRMLEYTDIKSVDETTLVFTLPEPYTFFQQALTIPIIRAKSFENALLPEITDSDFPGNRSPIGTGPFVLKSIIPDSRGRVRLFFRPNAYFYGESPYLESLVLQVYPNPEQLQQTELRFSSFMTSDVNAQENINRKFPDQYWRWAYNLPRSLSLYFNLDSPYMTRNNVRKALTLSIPKSEIAEDNWGVIGSPFFYEGVVSNAEYSLPRAKLLLDEIGYNLSNETLKRQDPENQPFSLRIITSTSPPIYSRIAQRLVRQWESELNLTFDFAVLEKEEFDRELQARNYDMVLFGANFGSNLDIYGPWHSQNSGQSNLSNLTNNQVDTMIAQIYAEGATDYLFPLAKKIQSVNPSVPLLTPTYYFYAASEIQGIPSEMKKLRSHADWFSSVNQWYMNQDRKWNQEMDSGKISSFASWLFSPEERFDPEAPTDE